MRAASTALVLLLSASAAGAQTSSAPDAQRGKEAWGVALRCQNCHGAVAEGGFGPDLAGRGLSLDQFRRAVREPWGVMLAYSERQLSEQTVADMWAYTNGLPKVAQPGKRTYTAPPGAPLGQVLLVDTIGCANCHEPELRQPRRVLGGEAADVDFAYFAKRVYQHTEIYPTGRMGNYAGARVPEPLLRELFRFLKDDLQLLVPIAFTLDAGKPVDGNTTYTLLVKNTGKAGRGLAAGDVTVSLKLTPNVRLVSATGPGTQQNAAGAVSWKLAKLAPQEEQRYAITLAGTPGAPAAEVFKGSRVDYMKPSMRGGAPNLQLVDERFLGSKNDWQPVTVAPPPAPAARPATQ